MPQLPDDLGSWLAAGAAIGLTLYLLGCGVRQLRQQIRFEREARPAVARVLSLTETGMQAADTTWTHLSVEVRCLDGSAPYVALLCEQTPRIRMHNVRVGSLLHVLAQPSRPDQVEVRWGEPLPATPPELAKTRENP